MAAKLRKQEGKNQSKYAGVKLGMGFAGKLGASHSSNKHEDSKRRAKHSSAKSRA